MNKLPVLLSSLILFLGFALSAPFTRAYAAPNVRFSPTSATVVVNEELTVTVQIDAETNTVIASDAVVSYAGDDLSVVAVSNGGFFPEFSFANNPTGRLELHGYISASYQNRTGTGTLATIRFKAKKGSGSSAVSFTCSGAGNDTNIITTAGINILSCSQTNQVGVSYLGTTTPTPTPTPPAGGPTPTPGSGTNTIPYCASLSSDVSSTVGAPLAVRLSCAGVDPDGYISAAEFTFGDGTSQLVEQNAGSPGSISTTHTYTTIGTLGASCRVRDNNQVFSPTTDTCKTIITIRPRSTQAPSSRRVVIPQEEEVTPTPEEVALVEETPEPTPEEIPTPTPAQPTPGSRRIPWWMILGSLGLIGVGALLYVFGRKKHLATPPPPPPPASS